MSVDLLLIGCAAPLAAYLGALAGKGLSMPNRWCARLTCWRAHVPGLYHCARHLDAIMRRAGGGA